MKHLNQLWPGDWVKQISKMNEAVGMKNRFTMDGGGGGVCLSFQKARVLEMYWLRSIVSYVWEEMTQSLK